MAWCPKCKNEYRDGITICADCGCELVSDEREPEPVKMIFGDKDQMTALKDFLEYNHIDHVNISFDEKEQLYELSVWEKDRETASKLTRVFLQERVIAEETKHLEWNTVAQQAAYGEPAEDDMSFLMYKSNSEKAEDNRSSAWTFLVVGVLGLGFVILGLQEVLPFSVDNLYLFYGVMSAIFLLLIVVGLVSMKNAIFFEKKAKSENSLKQTITEWCKENLQAEEIDSQIEGSGGIAEEALFFRRTELMKKKLNHQFMNLDQAFVEHFIDVEAYDMIFGEENDMK